MLTLKRIDKNNDEFNLAYNIRLEVFTGEQNVPIGLLVDEFDKYAIQVAAYEDDMMAGCGRIVIDGKIGQIGRIAVLADKRKLGIGKLICEKLINIAIAEHNIDEVILNSQCSAQKFYEKLGFTAVGSIYVKAGIEHVDMRKKLR